MILPNIDAVLISHNHYDHLDLRTLHQLADRGHSTFIVAARGARLLRSEKIEPVYELDWGESLTRSGISIHCVPAVHFSSRGIFDRNKGLWCGYAISRKSFCANSRKVRLATACIIAHRGI
jgi:N-acyl-phosphatidylethanolamine-hydrolysing phospholipase D